MSKYELPIFSNRSTFFKFKENNLPQKNKKNILQNSFSTLYLKFPP